MVNLKKQNNGCHADIPTYYFTPFAAHLQDVFYNAGTDWGFVQI